MPNNSFHQLTPEGGGVCDERARRTKADTQPISYA
jgi:hypothetical protein